MFSLLFTWIVAIPAPPRLPAEVDDAYATRSNVAGLGFLEGAQLRLLVARDVSQHANDFALFGAASVFDLFTVGAGAEWDDLAGPTRRTVSLGTGASFGALGLGVGYRNVDSDGAVSLGMTVRPLRWLSASISSLDVGQSLGPRPYDLGLAVRILDERLLISGRWRILHGEALDSDDGRADLSARLLVEPLDGVLLGISTDTHFRTAVEVGITFDQLQLGGGVFVDKDQELSGTVGEIALSTKESPSILARSRVAVFELQGALVPDASFDLFSLGFKTSAYGGMPLLLEHAAKSREVLGLFLKIGSLQIGWAKAEELRAAIGRARDAGKRVDCQLTATGDLEYFLASACTSIVVPPPLNLNVDGLAANFLYFAEALDRLGVDPEVVRIGDHKTAPENLLRTGMSKEQAETTSQLLDHTLGTLIAGVSKARSLEREAVEVLIHEGTLTSSQAKARGLIDRVLYPDQIEDYLAECYDGPVAYVEASQLAERERSRWAGPARIAVVAIDAPITGGDSQELPFGLGRTVGARTLVRTLEAIRTDGSIAAVVLRVDTPGGDAFASDLIARAVERVNEVKPVVASFGDVAASGGYYVAAPAKLIYSEPTTITGSIGIYAVQLSFERLLGKLGVSVDTLTRGTGANRGSGYHPSSPEERQMLEAEITAYYDRFVEVVAKGRKIEVSRLRELGGGRVYSGTAAKAVGLVDELGGLFEAINRAKTEAGLDPDQAADLVVLPRGRISFAAAARSVFLDVPQGSELVQRLPREFIGPLSLSFALWGGSRAAAVLPFWLRVD